MKSLLNDQPVSAEVSSPARTAPRRGVWHYLRDAVTSFKADLRVPLAGQDQRSRFGRIKARLKFLLARHGWKLVALVVIYYLIRDTLLYIILPYFLARQVFG
jgi:hypothetical protein